eukprot:PhF_6_TR7844/c0_g1_i1/m.11420
MPLPPLKNETRQWWRSGKVNYSMTVKVVLSWMNQAGESVVVVAAVANAPSLAKKHRHKNKTRTMIVVLAMQSPQHQHLRIALANRNQSGIRRLRTQNPLRIVTAMGIRTPVKIYTRERANEGRWGK